jgi:glycosyltransferase involved in cell wall biosynthesis
VTERATRPRILVVSSDLEVGGIERSLLGLLDALDPSAFDVSLFLHRRGGAFFPYVPPHVRLLPAVEEYEAFSRSISEVFREGRIRIGLARLAARLSAEVDARRQGLSEPGYLTLQRMWRNATPLLPRIPGTYDAALSFMGPHYPVLEKVDAGVKIGWVHTDYQMVPADGKAEAGMWSRLDWIAAVSEACRQSFVKCFPALKENVLVIENILSPELVRRQAMEFDARGEMPEEPGVTRVLTVGRFSRAKAFDVAVLACKRLMDAGVPVRWYAIGYGPDEAALREAIGTHRLEKEFILLGKKVNPYPYMAACDIYAQPSRYEGKAVTVIEAQILGKPVLITRYPTSASQVEEGVDGHICELGPDGVAAGVRRLIEDPAYRLRLAGTARSREYGRTNEVKKVESVIDGKLSVAVER